MTERIVVINPNSTDAVTRAMDAAVDGFRFVGGPTIDCLTLAEGPPGIESQRDADGVIMPLLRLVEREDNRASAFVVACFSDPGVHTLREATARPVFGIAEAGLATALNLGNRVGIIAIRSGSIARQARFVRAMGIAERVAGSLAIDMGVVELDDRDRVLTRMTQVGMRLRDERGADVVIMGCAGMADYRAPLQDALGVAVVEPTQAALGMAIVAITAGYRRAAA